MRLQILVLKFKLERSETASDPTHPTTTVDQIWLIQIKFDLKSTNCHFQMKFTVNIVEYMINTRTKFEYEIPSERVTNSRCVTLSHSVEIRHFVIQ